MKINAQVGDIARIVFLDHAEGDAAIKFEVFGRIAAKDRKMLMVICWGYVDSDQLDDNVHSYAILRSTILEYDRLGKKRQ